MSWAVGVWREARQLSATRAERQPPMTALAAFTGGTVANLGMITSLGVGSMFTMR